MALVLRRLNRLGDEGRRFARLVLEAMISDLDAALREIGASDPSMGRKMKHVAHSIHARLAIYDQCLSEERRGELADALRRNLFGTLKADDANTESFIRYLTVGAQRLENASLEILRRGHVDLPDFRDIE